MKTVAVSGASGLVGTRLCAVLAESGHRVVRLVRRPEDARADAVYWDPDSGEADVEGLEGLDAVVHLAGENIGAGRWTAARKQRIRTSRVAGTRFLARLLADRTRAPAVLVSASAVGFYGDCGATPIDERTPAGTGFLAEVCQAWEAATEPASGAGLRVVHARLGVVLAKEGGALAAMRLPFSLGLGGRLGEGTQFMSWVALEDAARALAFAVENQGLRGPVNVVAPGAVTNADFTRALGQALHRPTVIPVPRFAVKLGLGSEMAHEMLLGGARVVPRALTEAGFKFRYPELASALAAALA